VGAGRGSRVVGRTGSLNFEPPPTASTDTASTTSSFVSSMNPKRDLCAASKANFIFSNVIADGAGSPAMME
jgi:hypothetical protein